jgi:hypothetical protein
MQGGQHSHAEVGIDFATQNARGKQVSKMDDYQLKRRQVGSEHIAAQHKMHGGHFTHIVLY